MKSLLVGILAGATVTVALADASITETFVRQEWPWSSRVTVEYVIEGVTEPVDVACAVSKGGVVCTVPESALSGDRFGVAKSGLKRIYFDPVKAFGMNAKSADYTFALSVGPSDVEMNEVLYRIFDLVNTNVTDVTRGDLLNGRYGSVETDYGAIGPGYKTSLKDVLIWTGVTNDVAYKTTKLVMRKIPAGTYVSGANFPGDIGKGYAHTMTKDVFASVFELTQAQWRNCGAPTGSKDNYKYRPTWVGDLRPMETFNSAYALFGHAYDGGRAALVPGSTGDNCLFRALQNRFHDAGVDVPFGLPTTMQWLIAARGGTSTYYNDGVGTPGTPAKNAQMDALGRYAGNGGLVDNGDGTITTNGTVEVGLYRPNAFGLYDTLGNVKEFCCDYISSGSLLNDTRTDYCNVVDNRANDFFANDYMENGAQSVFADTRYQQLPTDVRFDPGTTNSRWWMRGRVGVRVFYVVEPADDPAAE